MVWVVKPLDFVLVSKNDKKPLIDSDGNQKKLAVPKQVQGYRKRKWAEVPHECCGNASVSE